MKKNFIFVYLLLVFTVILVSCDHNGINGILSRVDPVSDVVVAESFNEGRTIFLKWNADLGADSYIISRSVDGAKGIHEFFQVYTGTETKYIDQNIDVNLSYVYRLDKKRGNAIFEGKELTFFERTRNDPFYDKVIIERLSSDTELYLEWRPDSGADSYILTKSKETATGFDEFKDIYHGLATSYSDKAIRDAMVYVYRLDKMRDGMRIEGEEVTVFSRYAPIPDKINLEIIRAGGEVQLSWRQDPNADSYIIQKESIDEFNHHVTFEPIITQQITHLDSEIEIDKTYVYRLDKVRGSITYKGIETSIYSRMRDAPFPDIIVASNLGNKALLSWKNDVNADSYIIQKQSIDIENNTLNQSIPCDKTSYLDNNVAIDMIYVYRLDKMRGGRTYEGISLTTFSTTRPDPFPGVITAESLSDGKAAHLSWEPDSGADVYRVMRALNSLNFHGDFEWQDVSAKLQMLSVVSAIDTQIDDDKSYVYRLDKKRNGAISWDNGNQVTVFSWNRPPPFDEAPVVESFRMQKTILISWNVDIGADIYKLYRRNDSNLINPNYWELIYQGTSPAFEDKTAIFEDSQYTRYEYHLAKIRNGTPYFDDFLAIPFTSTLAVASPVEKDAHEPNDDYLNATLLDYQCASNIYCFRFRDARVLEDRDWYKVSVPSGKKAIIKIYYTPPAISNMLKVYEPSKLETPIIDGAPFEIKNETSVQQFVCFAIIPNRNQFVPSSDPGGQIIGYTIYWQSTSN